MPQCCYAKNKNELKVIKQRLKELSIISYKVLAKTHDANGGETNLISNPIMSLNAYSKFENGINSCEDFNNAFGGFGMNMEYTYIKNENGNVVLGDNNFVNNNMSGISDSTIIKELLSRNISIDEVDKIRNEIKDLSEELNKNKTDMTRISNIFSKIKLVGGNVLLLAFNFLTKPEVVAIIDKLVHN